MVKIEGETEEQAYERFNEEFAAVMEGRATALVHCYLCEPDINKRMYEDAGPLRGVDHTYVGGGSDPTEVLVLIPCGHEII